MAFLQSPMGLIAVVQATVSSTANNVTGDGTFYTVLFNNVSSDTAGAYNAGTGIFTVPVKGFYQILANVTFQAVNNPAFNDFLIDISAGSSQIERFGNPYLLVNTSSLAGLVVSGGVVCNAGDTIKTQVRVSGGAKTVGVDGGSLLSICLVRILP